MGDYRSEAVIEDNGAIGRFPANLVLGHCENCRRRGTKKVKGNAPVASGYDRLNKKQAELGYRPGEYQKGEVEPGYCHTDVDGKETVEDWECVDDCVVKTMGEQSGEKKAGVAYEPKGKKMNRSIYGATNTLGRECGLGDTGTAARFFFNFSEQESDE
jgi:hypothetical protein